MNIRSPNSSIAYLFDNIAKKYDLLNHILSFGQDILWRKNVIKFISNRQNIKLVDLATGTGDQLITIVNKCHNVSSAIGIDIAQNMLNIAKQKFKKLHLHNKISLINANILELGLSDNCIDIISISFGIRNIAGIQQSLSEIYRVLKPSGNLIILEFSIPQNRIMKRIYLFYFRQILPKIGSWISGNKNAYHYLNQSVEEFPYGDDFVKILTKEGFKKIQTKLLLNGIATIYFAEKKTKHSVSSTKKCLVKTMKRSEPV